ncbi:MULTISPECIES: pyroglutamyl-peptidase I [Enterococcus]|uniref:Pyrrolidone-carboxylate peptidase n=2 Tax=root TaxID=1 RepID=A0A179EP64_ENTTH|nr:MULTISPECIES: pyroglutamyl-peptidase I [Enterococcus]ASZ06827.1 pyroglutamyl-peptidase I [Enterococcus thailandicus]MDA3965868.1 pyroglutamyl-peptidase I [Enterococcus thailandicus]MDK4351573.1 pyroglutamyl-peptidase I [Enterococcus thailandicus]MDT2733675.1 pyroglutamyl-peptidase I [Enterococcus thailandicus]MDT2750948.1 pyroglutamyl-peptidase I [Enterococcus thailandicus]
MKVLVTGFDPFGGDKVNPAYEAVKKMPAEIAGAEIIKLEVPTVFGKSSQVVREAIKEHQPEIVICVGQAGGRSAVSFERVAINLAEARIPDNEGNQPFDTALEEDGPAAYFTTLPIKAMTKNVHDHGLPAYISYTAGTFVCNDIMYRLLHVLHTEFPTIRGGFIHVPFSPDQVIERPVGTASMSLADIADSLTYAVEAAIENEQDISGNAGTTH